MGPSLYEPPVLKLLRSDSGASDRGEFDSVRRWIWVKGVVLAAEVRVRR